MTRLFLKLLKLIFVTRFTRPTLVLFSIFILLFILGLLSPRPSVANAGPAYYTIGVLSFLVFVSAFGAGLFIFKSDTDYLLTLPVERSHLALALFLAQFLGSAGITIFFIAPSSRVLAADSTTQQALIVVSLILLALFATSISVVFHRFGTPVRAALGAILATWMVSPFFGFGFAPSSVLAGNVLDGTLVSVAAGSVALYLAFRDLLTVRVGIFRTLSRTTTGSYGSQRSFLGLSPLRALYQYHLTLFEFAGRMSLAGGSSYRTTRARIQIVVAVASVLAVVYALLALNIIPIFPSSRLRQPLPIDFVPSIATVLLTSIIPIMLSQSGLANERAWLAFTSMPATKYIRHFLVSRVLSSLLVLSPFIAVDLALSFLGSRVALNAAVAILLFAPSSSVLTTYLSARVYPFQIKELGLQPAQFSLRQMLTVIPTFATVGFVGVTLFNPLSGVVLAAILLAVVAVILRSNRALQGLVFTLTEKGFI